MEQRFKCEHQSKDIDKRVTEKGDGNTIGAVNFGRADRDERIIKHRSN